MVDALASGASELRLVEVQVLSSAPFDSADTSASLMVNHCMYHQRKALPVTGTASFSRFSIKQIY